MNLTPEQLELLYCLLGALAIGYLFGYFYKRSVANKKYHTEIKELGHILDKKDIEIETASAKHGQLKQHMAVQASELKSLNQQVADLQGHVSSFENQAGLLHKEKGELEELLHSKISHLDEAQVRLQKLHADKESTQGELVKTQEALYEYKSASSSQHEKLTLMERELESKKALEQKIESLHNNLQEKDHVINDLKGKTLKLDEIHKENQQLRVKSENLSKELEHSKHELSQTETKQAPVDEELQLKYKSLEKELELKTSTIANLKKNNESLEQKVRTAVAPVSSVNPEELEGLKHKLTEKEALLKQSREKLENTEAKLIKVQNNTVDTSAIEKELQMAKMELSDKEKMLVATQDKLRTTQAKAKEIENKLQTTVSNPNPKNASYLAERDDSKKGWFSGFFTKDGKSTNIDDKHNK